MGKLVSRPWRAGHADPGELLKSRTSLGAKRHIAGRLFVPIQVALSLVLVAFAALLSQSVVALRSERTGFDIDHVTIQTWPLYLLKKKGEAKLNLHSADGRPDCRNAGCARGCGDIADTIDRRRGYFPLPGDGRGAEPHEDSHMAYNDVGPNYFQTMKTRIVAGREFAKNDRSLNVCVLNPSAAAFFFPHEQALGRYVRTLEQRDFPVGTACRVIGLAEDAKFFNVRQGPPRTIYFLSRYSASTSWAIWCFSSMRGSKRRLFPLFERRWPKLRPVCPWSSL